MRYATIGTVGYGLQIVCYLVIAAVSVFYLSTKLQISGVDVSGFLTPIPGLLVSAAWLYAGRARKSGLLTATGIIGIFVFLGSIVNAILSSVYAPPVGVQPSSPEYITSLLGIAAIELLVGILFVVYFVMETITFFSAGRIFAERMFRYAGWSRIFGLIAGGGLVVVASVYGFLYYLSSLASGSGGGPSTLAFVQYTTSPGSFLRLFSLAVAGVYVILTIPDAFAFLGFNNMKKEPEYQVRPTQDAPIAMPQATSARFCPNCGKDVPVNAKSCSSCGWWFCPGCGSAISEGSRFCSVCGRMLL